MSSIALGTTTTTAADTERRPHAALLARFDLGTGKREMLRSLERVVGRVRARPLQLELANESVEVEDPEVFAFALQARTEPASEALVEMLAMSDQALQAQLQLHLQQESRLAPVLARCMLEPQLVSEHLLSLSLSTFDPANGWRELFEALLHLSPRENAYKRVALVKYAQFLRKRQQLLKTVFELRLRRDAWERARPPATADSIGTDSGDDRRAATDRSPSRASILGLGGATGRRLPLRGAQRNRADAHGPNAGLRSLSRGEPVVLRIGRGRCASLSLGGNRFRLLAGERFYLIDPLGAVNALGANEAIRGAAGGAPPSETGAGANAAGTSARPLVSLVGRHVSCDVVVRAELRAISRRHLLIEPLDDTSARLTDLSTHGTAVPTEMMFT
ncbi:MAG: FHA domain-containing protein [Gammaproteobacteria bacterium]|nr:FHA domain-containing protein [Gammaproteobacteria bacterium]